MLLADDFFHLIGTNMMIEKQEDARNAAEAIYKAQFNEQEQKVLKVLSVVESVNGLLHGLDLPSCLSCHIEGLDIWAVHWGDVQLLASEDIGDVNTEELELLLCRRFSDTVTEIEMLHSRIEDRISELTVKERR